MCTGVGGGKTSSRQLQAVWSCDWSVNAGACAVIGRCVQVLTVDSGKTSSGQLPAKSV